MRIELYLCDTCNKQLSKGGVGKPHISVDFSRNSGWVEQNDGSYNPGKWCHSTLTLVTGIKQFCNGKCLGDYFDKLIKKESTKVKNK